VKDIFEHKMEESHFEGMNERGEGERDTDRKREIEREGEREKERGREREKERERERERVVVMLTQNKVERPILRSYLFFKNL
jgi:hypothetical protein